VWTVSRPLRELSIVNRNGFFRLLSALAFFNGMVTAGDKTLLLYYVDSALSFSAKDVAIMFLLVGFTAVIAQVFILKPLNDCIGERSIVIVCFIASVFSNMVYGLARNRQTLYAGICLGALTGMAFPTISAIKANNVVSSCKTCAVRKILVFYLLRFPQDESEQGRIQGALYSLQAIAAGVGPMMMRYVDHLANETWLGPGSMFFFAAFVQMFALYCAFKLPKDKSNSKNLEAKITMASQADEMVEL
jgi:hypothetical protein